MTVSQQFTQQTQTQPLLVDSQESSCTESPSAHKGAWGRLVGSCTVILRDSDYVFGRHRTCAVRVDLPEVSNRHCRLYRTSQGTVFIEDLSTNGTRVNGKKMSKGSRIPLQHQDHVELLAGKFFFIFNDLCSPEKTASATLLGDFFLLNHQTLGTGTFATVKVAIDNRTGERYACKIIEKRQISSYISSNQMEQIRREISILKTLDHPNIVRIIEVMEHADQVMIFLELINGGELFDVIRNRGGLPEAEAKFIFFQLLQAVKYLHDQNITHRDIKPENVLMSSSAPFCCIKLTDFGLAKSIGNETILKTLCGTYNYLAPEVLFARNKGYTTAVDCWSLGVTLFAMLSGTLPFAEQADSAESDDQEDFSFTPDQYRLYFDAPIWATISASARNLIELLLDVNPASRLSVPEALIHPWIFKQTKELLTLYEQIKK